MSSTSEYMIQRSMRDITGRAIAVAANPNVAATTTGRVYPVLGPQNKILDSNYRGDVNIMGNIPVQIANSPNSSYLHEFDYASMGIGVNYRYLAVDTSNPCTIVNAKTALAMQEALAHAYSETFNDLAFFNGEYESAMVDGFEDDPEEGTGTIARPDAADYLPVFAFYQGVLQNILLLDAKYKQLMASEDQMMNQAWLRETPQIKQTFGLLKKTAIRSYFEAITSILPGNAVDLEWSQQVNVLCNVPSKKSQSYDDPLIVIDAFTKLPKTLKMSMAGKTILDYKAISSGQDGHDYHVEITDMHPDGSATSTDYDVESLFYDLITRLSPYSVVYYCRQIADGTSGYTPRDYYNMVDNRLNALANMLSRFSADFADLNVVLKVMNRVGLNNWTFGVTTTPLKVGVNYNPVYNKLLYDVFAASLSGGSAMVWDDNTKRWRFWTIWDKTKDIPTYDSVAGGAFLTLSTRSIPEDEDMSQMRYCLPVLFDAGNHTTSIKFLNRLNHQYVTSYLVRTSAEVKQSAVFARLQAINQPDLQFKIPYFIRNDDYDDYIMDESFLCKVLEDICGCGAIATPAESGGYIVIHEFLSPTVMNVLDIEMEDISNVMLNQVRSHAPFRVTADPVDTVGFAKVVS